MYLDYNEYVDRFEMDNKQKIILRNVVKEY